MTRFKKTQMNQKDRMHLIKMLKARKELDNAIVDYVHDMPDEELVKISEEDVR
jgi:hypothetical protein